MTPWLLKTLNLPIQKMGTTRPSLGRLFHLKVTTVEDQKHLLLLLAVATSSKKPADYSEEVDIDNPNREFR